MTKFGFETNYQYEVSVLSVSIQIRISRQTGKSKLPFALKMTQMAVQLSVFDRTTKCQTSRKWKNTRNSKKQGICEIYAEF